MRPSTAVKTSADSSRFKPCRPELEARQVNVDFPAWVVQGLDREAGRLGVTRQSLIKMWIAERLGRGPRHEVPMNMAEDERISVSFNYGWVQGSLGVYSILYRVMEFEFDPAKSAANKAKHGIDFVEAQALWRDDALVNAPVPSKDEPRFLVIGRLDGKVWTAVCTLRGESVRINSVRRARKEEIGAYEGR